MVGILIYSAFLSDEDLYRNLFKMVASSGGISGSFYLYMKWRVVEIVLYKLQNNPEQINSELITRALGFIPKKLEKQNNS